MLEFFSEMWALDFMRRALIVGPLVALCASLLGVSLVLKRYSMIGDGLSHVGFGALAVATAVGWAPLTVTLPVVTVAAFFLLRLSENSKIKGDAAIALISTSALAIGVIVLSGSVGMNTDVCNYMFGSVLAIGQNDMYLSIPLAIVVIAMFVLLYHRIFAVTFDESFAQASGLRASAYNTVIALLTAVTVVLGMRLLGAMLISGLIIFPALTSMRFCRSFRGVIISSAVISVVSYCIGMALSYLVIDFNMPPGATVVVVNLFVFICASIVGIVRKEA